MSEEEIQTMFEFGKHANNRIIKLIKMLQNGGKEEIKVQDSDDNNRRIKIESVLTDIEMNNVYRGYRYTIVAVLFIMKNSHALMQEVYQSVAEICNTTSQGVERGIYRAKQKTLQGGKVSKIFGYSLPENNEMTNREFLYAIKSEAEHRIISEENM